MTETGSEEEVRWEVPHGQAIGMVHDVLADGTSAMRLPYGEHLIGDPDTGVVHGGVITTLLDQTCGMVARPPDADRDQVAIATLDLRIDYMGPATPGRDLWATGECYKRTTNIAFVRAWAFHDSPADPVATCVAAFMMGTPNAPRGSS
ncbi:MAG TPA: PaaI family thioesterase [Pseudomonadales bacterium]